MCVHIEISKLAAEERRRQFTSVCGSASSARLLSRPRSELIRLLIRFLIDDERLSIGRQRHARETSTRDEGKLNSARSQGQQVMTVAVTRARAFIFHLTHVVARFELSSRCSLRIALGSIPSVFIRASVVYR